MAEGRSTRRSVTLTPYRASEGLLVRRPSVAFVLCIFVESERDFATARRRHGRSVNVIRVCRGSSITPYTAVHRTCQGRETRCVEVGDSAAPRRGAAQAHTNTHVHASYDEAFMLLEASQEAGALPFMLLDRRLVGAHASCPTRTWCIRGAPRADETLSSAARNAQCHTPK